MRREDPPWTWAVPFPGLGPGLNEEGVSIGVHAFIHCMWGFFMFSFETRILLCGTSWSQTLVTSLLAQIKCSKTSGLGPGGGGTRL